MPTSSTRLEMREILLFFLQICCHAKLFLLTQMLVMMTVSSTGNTAELSDVTIHSESTYLSFYIVIEKKKALYFHSLSRIVIDVGNKC